MQNQKPPQRRMGDTKFGALCRYGQKIADTKIRQNAGGANKNRKKPKKKPAAEVCSGLDVNWPVLLGSHAHTSPATIHQER